MQELKVDDYFLIISEQHKWKRVKEKGVIQPAAAGVVGWRTLGKVSEQMDSLLDGQSGQRILPYESCLQVRGERERERERHPESRQTVKLSHTDTSTEVHSPQDVVREKTIASCVCCLAAHLLHHL